MNNKEEKLPHVYCVVIMTPLGVIRGIAEELTDDEYHNRWKTLKSIHLSDTMSLQTEKGYAFITKNMINQSVITIEKVDGIVDEKGKTWYLT